MPAGSASIQGANLVVIENEVDAAETPAQASDLLRRGDIADDEVVQRLSAGIIVRAQDADHKRLAEAPAGADQEAVFPLQFQTPGQRFTDDDRTRLGDDAVERFIVDIIAFTDQVGTKGRLGQGVDTEQAQGLNAAFDADKLGHHRRAAFDTQLKPDAGVQIRGKPVWTTDYLMRGAAHKAFAAESKGAARGLVGNIDGDDHADAQGDAQHEHRALEKAPADIAQGQADDDGLHGFSANQHMGGRPAGSPLRFATLEIPVSADDGIRSDPDHVLEAAQATFR